MRLLPTLTAAALLIHASAIHAQRAPVPVGPHWYGGDLAVGAQFITMDDDPQEAAKKGTLVSLRLLYEYRAPRLGLFSLSLGGQITQQEGETRIWEQRIKTNNPFLDAGYLVNLGSSPIRLGVVLRQQIGAGAYYDQYELSKLQYLVSAGPQVQYVVSTNQRQWEWVVGASALRSLNAPDRAIWQIPISIGVRIPWGEAPPKPEPAPTEPTPQAAEEVFEVNIDSTLINFDLDKATLRPGAEKFLERIAAILVEQSDNWGHLTIAGHTDATGKAAHNKDLSARRARAVLEFLKNRGVETSKIESGGYGSERLLAGVEPKDARHRRVEFEFSKIVDKKRLKEPLDIAIEEARKAQTP